MISDISTLMFWVLIIIVVRIGVAVVVVFGDVENVVAVVFRVAVVMVDPVVSVVDCVVSNMGTGSGFSVAKKAAPLKACCSVRNKDHPFLVT